MFEKVLILALLKCHNFCFSFRIFSRFLQNPLLMLLVFLHFLAVCYHKIFLYCTCKQLGKKILKDFLNVSCKGISYVFSRCQQGKVLKELNVKVILNVIKVLKLKTVKVLKMFLKGNSLAAVGASLLQTFFLDFISDFSGIF